METLFNGKVVLITGGTGSFGNAILQRFLKTDIREIRIFSRDEKKQDDLRHVLQAEQPDVAAKVKFFIGDVREWESVYGATYGVDYVFHAAALKQVPSCEFFPMEAYQTNVDGTYNILQAALKRKVKQVVVLSTDKAAYPVNVMGFSKAMMERVVIAEGRMLNNNNTVLCCTRFGNVMGCHGSVIPLWAEQIKTGKPITITNPNMTRFMMTMDDAVDRVMQVFEEGNNGDIFVQKAPAATLTTIAQALTELYKPKYGETGIQMIGTRHGEKLFETLVTREEMVRAIDCGAYFRIPCEGKDLNYDKYFTKGNDDLSKIEDYHSNNAYQLNKEEMKNLLLKLDFIKEDLGL